MAKRLLAAAAAILAMLSTMAAGPALADSGPTYYLSLGDSLAAGVQPGFDHVNIPFTDESYTDDLFNVLHEEEDSLAHAKFGCPGETTVTMIDGGICSYATGKVQLPATNPVSQLDGALNFIRSHPGRVELITIDIGANDLLVCNPADPNLQTCVSTQFAQVAEHLAIILAELRAVAPRVPIVAMNYYNPFLASWLTGPAGQALAQATTDLFVQFNALILNPVYGAFNVPIADVTGTFQTTNFALFNDVPVNVGLICQWTWMCDTQRGPNIHPNRAGYQMIADTFEREIERRDLLDL